MLRVGPDTDKIAPGYLYAFLSSKYGVPMIANAAYGAIIQHIEPEQTTCQRRLWAVGRGGDSLRVQSAADLRVRFQVNTAATRDLFESAGL